MLQSRETAVGHARKFSLEVGSAYVRPLLIKTASSKRKIRREESVGIAKTIAERSDSSDAPVMQMDSLG